VISIEELSDKIVNEYNKAHGSDGRYISGGNSSGEFDVTKHLTSEEIKKVEDATVLTGTNPMVQYYGMKPQVARDEAAREMKRTAIIEEMTGVKISKESNGMDWSYDYCTNPVSRHTIIQSMIKNKLSGLSEEHSLTRDQIEALNKFGKINVTPEMIKAGAIYAHFNQTVMKNEIAKGNYPSTAYRGIHSTYARDVNVLANSTPDKTIKITVSALSSFTVDPVVARNYAINKKSGIYKSKTTPDWAVIETKIDPKKVWDSNLTSMWYIAEKQVSMFGGSDDTMTVKIIKQSKQKVGV
jgi:hypothetical protein